VIRSWRDIGKAQGGVQPWRIGGRPARPWLLWGRRDSTCISEYCQSESPLEMTFGTLPCYQCTVSMGPHFHNQSATDSLQSSRIALDIRCLYSMLSQHPATSAHDFRAFDFVPTTRKLQPTQNVSSSVPNSLHSQSQHSLRPPSHLPSQPPPNLIHPSPHFTTPLLPPTPNAQRPTPGTPVGRLLNLPPTRS
jgi:hypothetical protein